MRAQPIIAGIIIAIVGYVLLHFGLIANKTICWGVVGLGALIFLIGLVMKSRRAPVPVRI